MKISDCCGAILIEIESKICSNCKEHCGTIEE